MAFTRKPRRGATPVDPEALYRQLAPTNSGPDSLWSHQSDLLRDWHASYRQKQEVALELPTGAGKTLLGGLLAEWLRMSEGKPVAYVCPNNQLAAQAHARLTEYGVNPVLLTGSARNWDAADRSKFTTGDAVAVSNYHHIFNSNPVLTGAGTLILDDAHAGEQPVAAAWSINVERSEGAYKALLAVVSDGLDSSVASGLADDLSVRRFHRTVHLVSPVAVAAHANEIEAALDAAVQAGTLHLSKGYTLGTLAGHLGHCLIYATHQRFLIRPLISPTGGHAAFNDPDRRIYMSATLGAGGELERAFGRERIDRMPVPRGWDKQGTGRRFFVFPELTTDLSSDDTRLGPWLSGTIARHERAALITPAGYISTEILDAAKLPADFVVLDGKAVENDMSLFTSEPKAVLDLANRYDGVDLPDDACRLLVVAGLPAQGDLQERFLYEALGAGAVLQERVRSRIVQGVGRATRNAKDHATVVVLGDKLTNFMFQTNVLTALREELQAEIEFGRDQSVNKPLTEVDDNIDLFLAQGQEWRDVEADIVDERDHRTRQDPPATAELAATASPEVRAIHQWWDGDLDGALTHATNVLDELRKNPKATRYAALWNYLAASWARTLAEQTGDPSGTYALSADAYMEAAREAGRGTAWLSRLAHGAERIPHAHEYDDLDQFAAKNLIPLVRGWTAKNQTEMDQAKAALAQPAAKPYESALKVLGTYLGASESFDAGGAQAAPDSTWIFGDKLWVCWEAKSEAAATSEISTRYVREANSHLDFVKGKRSEAIPVGSVTCFATPQRRIDNNAKAICSDNIFYLPEHAALDLLKRVSTALGIARRFGPDLDEAGLLSALKGQQCLPSQWITTLTGQPLATLGDE